MSVTFDSYVKNNINVAGNFTVTGNVDTTDATTLILAPSNAIKVEIADTGIVTECQGPVELLEGLDVTGGVTVSTTLAVGQSTVTESSAAFEVESTTKGLLFPRMTTSQRTAIGTSVAGLMVYDTTRDALFHYNGTNWVMMAKNSNDVTNIILGEGAEGGKLTGSGQYNVLLGRGSAIELTSGACNVLIGDYVAPDLSTGSFNIYIGANVGSTSVDLTGNSNTIIGESSVKNLTTGNTNTVLGYNGGASLTTGAQNTFLGAGTNGLSNLSNQIAIGFNAVTTKADQCMIGNSSLLECVPHSSASANIGTSTNPWNNSRFKGNMSVGSASDPVSSALIEMTSTTQGFLPPRMTSTQRLAINSPADGLMVYDTDTHSVWVYESNEASWFNQIVRKRFDAYNDATFEQCVSGTWSTLGWDVEVMKDAVFTHSTTVSPEIITFNSAGDYLITYSGVYSATRNNRFYQTRMEVNTGTGFLEIPSTNVYYFARIVGTATSSGTFIHTFAVGDQIRMTSQCINNDTLTALPKASRITITSI